MSLYEKYHSDINKNYIWNLICKISKDEYELNITGIKLINDYFLKELENVFKSIESDDLVILNKHLIDNTIDYISKNFLENSNENVVKDFESILKERQSIEVKSESIINESNINESNINESIGESNKNPLSSSINNLVEINENKEVNIDINSISSSENFSETKSNYSETINMNITENNSLLNQNSFTINSGKRTNIQSSRFNYKINIQDSNLNYVSRLLIPIENLFIFSMPILKIKLPDLNYEIIVEKKEEIENNKKFFGIYEPIEKKIIQNNKNLEKIKVKITDINDIEYTHNDILSVNIIEIKKNIIIFTCSMVHTSDYKSGDYIKIINNQNTKLNQFFIYPLKIRKIKDNLILCDINFNFEEEIEYKSSNIDMKIMNISNQNLIYFNL